MTPPAPAPRALLVNPSRMRQIVRISSRIKIIRLIDDPIDGRLEAAASATLRSGLSDNYLVLLVEAVHGQWDRWTTGVRHDLAHLALSFRYRPGNVVAAEK